MSDLSPGTAVFETDFIGEARFMAQRLGDEYTVTGGVDTLYAVRVKQKQIVPGVITKYDPPPIADRHYDWSACREGASEDDPVGFGQTEVQAIADLLIEEESA
jgi:hypothetical protein